MSRLEQMSCQSLGPSLENRGRGRPTRSFQEVLGNINILEHPSLFVTVLLPRVWWEGLLASLVIWFSPLQQQQKVCHWTFVQEGELDNLHSLRVYWKELIKSGLVDTRHLTLCLSLCQSMFVCLTRLGRPSQKLRSPLLRTKFSLLQLGGSQAMALRALPTARPFHLFKNLF